MPRIVTPHGRAERTALPETGAKTKNLPNQHLEWSGRKRRRRGHPLHLESLLRLKPALQAQSSSAILQPVARKSLPVRPTQRVLQWQLAGGSHRGVSRAEEVRRE